MIPAGEGIGTLNLVRIIRRKIKHISRGKVIVYIDNKKIFQEYYKEVTKESNVATEAGAIVAAIC